MSNKNKEIVEISILALLKLGIYLVFIIIFFRLVHIQLLNNQKYSNLADKQQDNVSFYSAKRGSVYTSDGFPIVSSRQTFELWFNSAGVENFSAYANSLSAAIGLPEQEIMSKITSGQANILITKDLDYDQYKKIKDQNMSNIFLNPVQKRYYPEENLLSNTLGYVKKDDDNQVNGYFGVEQYYNGDLQGIEGNLVRKKSAGGNTILQYGTKNIESKDGSDIYLTIDRYIQQMVEKTLENRVSKHGAISGQVIIIEPKTGKIIAIAEYPKFDLLSENYGNYTNSLISEIYEPGSVIKPITMASAIDLGLVDETTTYNDNVNQVFSGHTIKNWDEKNLGIITMGDVLKYSNNQGTAFVAMRLGAKNLLDYFGKFNFGKRTNIDLIGEQDGILYKNADLKDIELATAGFGQGIAMTPLQVVTAYTAFKNDGKIMRPYVVDQIVDGDQVYITPPTIMSKPISSNTVQIINKMLREVVLEGEVDFVKDKTFAYAGKTGTAQIPVNGQYDPEKTNATFVGFFENSDKVVIYAKLEQPNVPSHYASETVYPMWLDIANLVGEYYKISKVETESDTQD